MNSIEITPRSPSGLVYCGALLMAAVICLAGCDAWSVPDAATADLAATAPELSAVTPSDHCPVVIGEDLRGVVAPMFHPHVLNAQLRKAAEGLLLPAIQAVHGRFQIKLCETLEDDYQFEWDLRIHNREGLVFTGWSLVNRASQEELLQVQFSNKTESGVQVQAGGALTIGNDLAGEMAVAPMGFEIVVRATEVDLVGVLE
jgi:hypothetical protein